ncbi:MAG: choice-of-anchor J domain-containing protein, partial [Acidobacteria bacterium]|nr:choice-of-anchor J domain-containing protein [Acidobacteriota bacterium]
MRKTLFIFCLMSVLLAGFSLAATRGVVNNEHPKSLKAAGLMAPPPPVGYPYDDNAVLMERFEDGVPPHNWGRWIENENSPEYTWYAWDWLPYGEGWAIDGRFSASILKDDMLEPQDEWLISQKINLANFPNLSVSFFWMSSYYWAIDLDTFDFEVYVRVNDLADWELVWSDDDYIGPAFSYDRWIYTEVDLSPWAGATNARFAFRYVGADGAQVLLDNVMGHANTAELELAGDAEVISSACPDGIVPEAPLPVRATILDAGDQATVEIALANTGTGPATNVRGILTPKNPWAKVVQGT